MFATASCKRRNGDGLIRWTLIAAIGLTLVLGPARTANGEEPITTTTRLLTHEQTVIDLRAQVRRLTHRVRRNQQRIRRQYLTITRQRRELRRAQRRYGSIPHMLTIAATAYGQSASAMIRVADCESGLWPYARNASSGASGLAQFLPSTWRSTPFGRYSIFDPWAQSLAMGWMWSKGRKSEWVCR